LDPSSRNDRFRNLWHVRERDVPIEEVLRLHQDRDAPRALVETARRAGARNGLGKPAAAQLGLEGLLDLFRPLLRARALGMVVGAAVHADEEVVLALGHLEGRL